MRDAMQAIVKHIFLMPDSVAFTNGKDGKIDWEANDQTAAATLDGPLGVAAALHAAAALASRGPLAPCGLATLAMFGEDSVPVHAGTISPPLGPGLGALVVSGPGNSLVHDPPSFGSDVPRAGSVTTLS